MKTSKNASCTDRIKGGVSGKTADTRAQSAHPPRQLSIHTLGNVKHLMLPYLKY